MLRTLEASINCGPNFVRFFKTIECSFKLYQDLIVARKVDKLNRGVPRIRKDPRRFAEMQESVGRGRGCNSCRANLGH